MIKKIFIRGLARVLPITITLYILISLFIKIDQLLQPYILQYLKINIPGLGFMIIIILIFLMGLFKVKIFSKQFNKFINKVPIAKSIYIPLKDVAKIITDKDIKTFKKVVEVEFPLKDTYSIGFITNDSELKHAIMIPTCPNISNGFLIYKYENEYEILDMKVEDAIKKIVSMGVL